MTNPALAPVVLFVFNRPEHTERTLEALAANSMAQESVLHVFADGPANLTPGHLDQIKKTREIIRKKQWCGSVELHESEVNRGLAASIVSGVTGIVNRYGKVIVLEDDIVTSPGFLTYMNAALAAYENTEQVMHVSGYMYPVSDQPDSRTVFLRVLSCWGWGTWARAWAHYSDRLDFFMDQLKTEEQIREFNIDGHASFYHQLKSNYDGKLKTWAVRWYASWYFKNGVSLFPATTLTENIGHDGSGLNCVPTGYYQTRVLAENIPVLETLPLAEDAELRKKIDEFYRMETELFGRKPDKKSPLVLTKAWIARKIARVTGAVLQNYLKKHNKELLEDVSSGRLLSESVIAATVILPEAYAIRKSAVGDYCSLGKNPDLTLTLLGRYCTVGDNFISGAPAGAPDEVINSQAAQTFLKEATVESRQGRISQRPVLIGNAVWIGSGVMIAEGVTVGNGAFIEAGSVVLEDIPPFAVTAGNPARVKKFRFSPERTAEIERTAWWTLSATELRDALTEPSGKFQEILQPGRGDENA